VCGLVSCAHSSSNHWQQRLRSQSMADLLSSASSCVHVLPRTMLAGSQQWAVSAGRQCGQLEAAAAQLAAGHSGTVRTGGQFRVCMCVRVARQRGSSSSSTGCAQGQLPASVVLLTRPVCRAAFPACRACAGSSTCRVPTAAAGGRRLQMQSIYCAQTYPWRQTP
jgi:hypothetical protein